MADTVAGHEPGLDNHRVLVVEDEYFIADDLCTVLRAHGARVVGPVGRGDEAVALLDAAPVDLAVLDIDLHGQPGYGVADALRARGVPFVFATGYGVDAIRGEYRDVPRWEKPYRYEALLAALSAITKGG